MVISVSNQPWLFECRKCCSLSPNPWACLYRFDLMHFTCTRNSYRLHETFVLTFSFSSPQNRCKDIFFLALSSYPGRIILGTIFTITPYVHYIFGYSVFIIFHYVVSGTKFHSWFDFLFANTFVFPINKSFSCHFLHGVAENKTDYQQI